MVTKTEKNFDCIAFKRKVQAEIYEETRDMTPQQRIAYFNESARTGPFAKFWRESRIDATGGEPDDADE